jgi:quinol monooxygenase YgiN
MVHRYKDKAALAAHRDTPHYEEVIKAGADILAAPPKIVVLTGPTGFTRS